MVDMPFQDPARVELRKLRVAFHTDNSLAPADSEVAGVRSARRRVPSGEWPLSKKTGQPASG